MSEITFETRHDSADEVARCVSPDNTDDMETRAENGVVVTTIRRDDTGSLRSTADDYLRNLGVASEVLDSF